jgi:hypothetical protein
MKERSVILKAGAAEDALELTPFHRLPAVRAALALRPCAGPPITAKAALHDALRLPGTAIRPACIGPMLGKAFVGRDSTHFRPLWEERCLAKSPPKITANRTEEGNPWHLGDAG